MNKNLLIFLTTFLIGALAALAVRTARHDPYPAAPVTAAPSNAPEEQPLHQHGGNGSAPSDDAKPVNTVCAICGMDVDPDVPTAAYQGKQVGFGCKMCPPKFAADPDRYGPAALNNEVLE